MPSTYAHYKMGRELVKKLGDYEKGIIKENPGLFMIGLHGPDILFYYKPLAVNETNSIGFDMHGRPGMEFFENAARVIKEHDFDKEYMAYAYGFVCHFALDVTCHGYIDEKIASSGISHTEIEVEFDRKLMVDDGLDPINHCLTGHIKPSMKKAAVIKDFYTGVSTEQMKEALDSMIKYNNLITTASRPKRALVKGLLKTTGNYDEMHGLMVNFEPNEACADSTQRLMELYAEAQSRAIRLIGEYTQYLNGTKELDKLYRYTFGTKLLDEED